VLDAIKRVPSVRMIHALFVAARAAKSPCGSRLASRKGTVVNASAADEDREVDLNDDDMKVLPDQTRDDTDRGWGERRSDSNDERLFDERPPHWD
jgi:hypothetical protein